jgi:hypothetical protein
MTPAETLAMAQQLLERPDARTAGVWPRAAALLARQALEQGMDAYWQLRGFPLGTLATLPQLICLREYLGDTELAGRANHTWGALSEACHHHPYELTPNSEELSEWMGTVGDLLKGMAGDEKV